MKPNTNYFVPVILLLILTALYLPSSCLAQTHWLANLHDIRAKALAKQGNYLEAARMYEKSATAEQASPEPRLAVLAVKFHAAGYNYFQVSQYDKAIKNFQQALEIDRKLGKEAKVALFLNNIGMVYFSWGQYDKAIEHYQQALEIDRRLGKEPEIAVRLNNIGLVYYSWSQYDKAIEYYQQALEINKRLGREADVARDLNNIGTVYKSRGQYKKAIELFQQALKIDRRLGNEALLAVRLNNIGEVYRSYGQYDKAIDHYQQALEIGKQFGKEDEIAIFINNIGQVYDSWGQYDKAIKYYQQALEIDRRLGRQADIPRDLNNIGMVYFSWGQYDKAIEHVQQAMEIDTQLGKEADVARDLSNIGMVYQSWGQYDKAIEHFHKALEISKRFGKEDEIATLLGNIGMVYQSRGQYNKSIVHYQQALDIVRRLGEERLLAVFLNNIGQIYYSWSQYDKAVGYYQQALAINRQLGREADVARDLNNIGMVYFSWEQYDKAIEHFQEALELDKRFGKVAEIATILNNIGLVYDSWGQHDKAIDTYKKSIQLIEKIRKTAKGDIRRDYLASQIGAYQLLASASLRKGASQGVLDAVEQSRARLLAERIAGIDSEMKIPSLQEVQKGLTEDEAVLLFSNIDHDNFILMVITGKEISMQEISKDSFLIKSRKQYKKPVLMLLEKQRGLFIPAESTKDDQAFEEKKLQADFEIAIHYYRILLTNPKNREETQEFGKLLHSLLIKPAWEQLAGKTKITIMPDGILGFLPFETLVDEKNNYLTQDYNLRYTQSLTIDNLLRGRDYTENERKPLLAMGGAAYEPIKTTTTPVDNAKQLALLQNETERAIEEKRSTRSAYTRLGIVNWGNLPGTLKEVNELSAIIKNSDTLIGDKVTENTVKKYSKNGKLADYKIIHFATHGLVVPEIPELSAIVLSQFKTEKDGEDGYLRMGEIAKLNLAADFVNLSACETGLGRIYEGEGIVGLTQSFLIAGANGLSVSLWQVADDSTAKFMTELYKKVKTTGMGYNQAITEVKRGFINGDYGEQWKSPFYWSPFVYYGK